MFYRRAQFPEIPVTVISNFQHKFLSKSTILFQMLQTKMVIFGNATAYIKTIVSSSG